MEGKKKNKEKTNVGFVCYFKNKIKSLLFLPCFVDPVLKRVVREISEGEVSFPIIFFPVLKNSRRKEPVVKLLLLSTPCFRYSHFKKKKQKF